MDAAEDEITVQRRHLSELDRRHAADATFGHTREHCWTTMQKLMSETYGAYLKPEYRDIDPLKVIAKEPLGTFADATFEKSIKFCGRVFAHLMFDRTYFQALKANGFEKCSADSVYFGSMTPAGLTDVARKQWASDFETLFAYAREEERTLNSLKKSRAKKKGHRAGTFDLGPPQDVPTAADEARKPPHPLREANQELYATNKKLANENASAEARLQRMKATLSALTSKIGTKLETPQDPLEMLSNVCQLQSVLCCSILHKVGRKAEYTRPDVIIQPEVALLTEQLKKLDRNNGCLQDELAELRKQLAAARQKKKAS